MSLLKLCQDFRARYGEELQISEDDYIVKRRTVEVDISMCSEEVSGVTVEASVPACVANISPQVVSSTVDDSTKCPNYKGSSFGIAGLGVKDVPTRLSRLCDPMNPWYLSNGNIK